MQTGKTGNQCWKIFLSFTFFLKLRFPGQCEIVELLLSRGIDADLDSAQGTPLHAAAISKDHDIIKILLEHHANVRHQFIGSLLCGV